MKNDIGKRPRLFGTLLLTLVVLLGSCTTELDSETSGSGGAGGQGKQEVLLKLQVPGTLRGKTRADTRAVDEKAESQVKDLYLLVFQKRESEPTAEDTFEYYVKASKGTGENVWSAKLHTPGYEQDAVVIANADGTKDNKLVEDIVNKLKRGMTKTAVRQLLSVELTADEKEHGFNAGTPEGHSPFTMCGQTQRFKLEAGTPGSLSVKLYRIMARVRVYFGTEGAGVPGFVPKTVRLYNFNDRAQVIPNGFGSEVTDTSIPTGATLLKGNAQYIVEDNKVDYSIYLFETEQPKDGEEQEKHAKRPCLVIGGDYKGATGYYRVDLAVPNKNDGTQMDYLDILRNHSYEVTVTQVGGAGAADEEKALAAPSQNITAGIIQWDETEVGNMAFDGKHFIGLGTMEFTVGLNGGIMKQMVAASQGLDWTATLLNTDEETTPDWIHFVDGEAGNNAASTTTGTGTEDPAPVWFRVDQKAAGITREAIMRFTAGKLMVDAKVVQNDEVTDGEAFIQLIGSPTTINIGNLMGMQTPVNFIYGPAGTTLSWEIVQDATTGVQFDQSQQLNGTLEAGTFESNSPDFKLTTNTLITDKSGVVGQARLKLTARHPSGSEKSVTVDLNQEAAFIVCNPAAIAANGKENKIYVHSDMNWTASAKFEGEAAGFAEDLQETSGVAAEDDNESAVIRLKTKEVLGKGKALAVGIKFKDNDTGAEVEVPITITELYEHDGMRYEVMYKSMRVSELLNSPIPDGYRLATQEEITELTDGQGIYFLSHNLELKSTWECTASKSNTWHLIGNFRSDAPDSQLGTRNYAELPTLSDGTKTDLKIASLKSRITVNQHSISLHFSKLEIDMNTNTWTLPFGTFEAKLAWESLTCDGFTSDVDESKYFKSFSEQFGKSTSFTSSSIVDDKNNLGTNQCTILLQVDVNKEYMSQLGTAIYLKEIQ